MPKPVDKWSQTVYNYLAGLGLAWTKSAKDCLEESVMASKKDSAAAVTPGGVETTPEFGSDADLASLPGPVANGPFADRMAKARAARGKGKKRDNENRPFYVIVGTDRNTDATIMIASLKSRRRAQQFMEDMPNFIKANVEKIKVWRCKEVTI